MPRRLDRVAVSIVPTRAHRAECTQIDGALASGW
jgi:hypothetical protein